MSKIIAIGREFGSGGHIVGEMLADRLGLPYYDNELIKLAVEHGGMKGRTLDKFDEKKSNPLLFEGNYSGNEHAPKGQPMEDVLFKLQSDVICSLAQKGDVIIVGRCADKILEDAGHKVISIFIAAPLEQRVERIRKLYEIEKSKALSLIKKKDKRRKLYYTHHTGKQWGIPKSYQYYFNTEDLSLDQIADEVAMLYRT